MSSSFDVRRRLHLAPQRPAATRPVRLLVDGLDGSGKTTLVDALLEMMAEHGITAVRHRGMLAEHHPLEKSLKRLRLAGQYRSSSITGAYLAGGFALDALLVRFDPPHCGDAVLVQEGYVDRTIAVGLAGGPFLPAVLALWASRYFAAFDVAAYVHADVEVRRERMASRERLDAGDRNSIDNPGFADRFNAGLLHFLGRRHRTLLVFDTAEHSPQEMARQILVAAQLLPSPAATAHLPQPRVYGLAGPGTAASA
ncbi:hypothetical protein [Streptacidiphilus jiangxiensis]|uniref:dTMP kinase n=1 Tax=Streptacidiphilus jiangxiensis TaxID=235985 RepID=A0A1H8AAG2_STRJI|nr:hypothetical protein [Streptacidiphilus jiangxiensis]SEM67765.1 dTMP kinase [Streptacidiphilus jiangxiensis]